MRNLRCALTRRRTGRPVASFELPNRSSANDGRDDDTSHSRTWPSWQNTHTKGESKDATPKKSQGPSMETTQPDADGAFRSRV